MSSREYRNPGDRLVRLHLLKPFELDPPPDRGLTGRLEKMLRSVGASGEMSVRARMITAVSSTKFNTVDGDPVSLVGLHGKDELLVKGPAWALERIGEGDVPEVADCLAWLSAHRSNVKAELHLLQRYTANLFSDSPVYHDAWRAQQFFGVEKEELSSSGVEFFQACESGLNRLLHKIEDLERELKTETFDWWFPWSEQWRDMQRSVLYVADNQHYTRYAFPSSAPETLHTKRMFALSHFR